LGGTCGTVCKAPTTTCSGTCTNTGVDPQNCGSCGNACGPYLNAQPGCDTCGCVYSCNAGYLDCASTTGCEINGQSDLNNCGACGATCALSMEEDGGVTDSPVCSAGVCNLNCAANWLNCDNDNSNGCETESDYLNCGSCGHQCSDEQSCYLGSCSYNE
jgi:hypothetical protein